MMASTDLNVIIASLQMAFILMDKLPNVYCIQFRREGMQPSDLAIQFEMLLHTYATIVYTHYRCSMFILVLCPKVDTHFFLMEDRRPS